MLTPTGRASKTLREPVRARVGVKESHREPERDRERHGETGREPPRARESQLESEETRES